MTLFEAYNHLTQPLPLNQITMNTTTQTTAANQQVKKGDNITIIGRRWFDRVNGNTYFSAVGIVNGIEVVHIPYEYGYENHYEERTFDELEKAGFCADREKYGNGSKEVFWQYCQRKGITKYSTASDVKRKKDL